jgi:lipid-binding SYLF domain-containing protein
MTAAPGRPLIAIAVLASAGASFAAQTESSVDKRLKQASEAFQDVMRIPDKSIPRDLMNKAVCIVVIPDLKKGAFVFGGKYGRGFASCREGPQRQFAAPAAIRIEGGSFGLQLGGSSTDVVLLVMNQRGMQRLLSDKFTLGGEAAVAAGPVGRNTSATTDAMMTAEILSWSRSRGVFVGLSLEGATLRPDNGENEKLYGKPVASKAILTSTTPTPPRARVFVASLNRFVYVRQRTDKHAHSTH